MPFSQTHLGGGGMHAPRWSMGLPLSSSTRAKKRSSSHDVQYGASLLSHPSCALYVLQGSTGRQNFLLPHLSVDPREKPMPTSAQPGLPVHLQSKGQPRSHVGSLNAFPYCPYLGSVTPSVQVSFLLQLHWVHGGNLSGSVFFVPSVTTFFPPLRACQPSPVATSAELATTERPAAGE